MSRSVIVFLLFFGWIIYLKPEARIAPFLDGIIKTEGVVTFAVTYVECRHKSKEIKIPYDSIAFMRKD